MQYTKEVNSFDKTQRVAIAGAIAIGIIGVVLTFSGIWALPGASNQLGSTNIPGISVVRPQNTVTPQNTTPPSSHFEELLKNGSPADAVNTELYLKVVESSLPQLLELEQKSVSQAEGYKLQEQIIQAGVNKVVGEDVSALVVPEPHITIAKDKSRASKQAYLKRIAELKEPLDTIASFFSNTDAISSKENLLW